jgi:hypothetical protein
MNDCTNLDNGNDQNIQKRLSDDTDISPSLKNSSQGKKETIFTFQKVPRKSSKSVDALGYPNSEMECPKNTNSKGSKSNTRSDRKHSFEEFSMDSSQIGDKKTLKKCLKLIRNRVSAQKSRQKKKAYIHTIEKELAKTREQLELYRNKCEKHNESSESKLDDVSFYFILNI